MARKYKYNKQIESNLPYIPYTYYVFHKPTGLKYYGVRYCNSNSYNRSNPDELWKTYFSSCYKIHDLIDYYGKDSFTVGIRKTFIRKENAIDWEIRVLRRLNVLKRQDWLNSSIPVLGFQPPQFHSPTTKAKMSEKRKGVPKSEEHRRKIGEANARRNIRQSTILKRACEYVVTFPDGHIENIVNLSEFCRMNNLSNGHMCNVAAGKRNHHKNFTIVKKQA